ncbi:MAG TPA: hypothetical protein VFH80_30160 [Solirubrobacteraceae bacterium]|nr:hypothetical protein [Solirubrobacteraceae bacterium]
MSGLFERMGLEGEEAAGAFHGYVSFMLGAVLFAAERKVADEQLARTGERPRGRFRSTRLSLESIRDISTIDPARDEALFEQGVRRLVESF